MLGAGVTTHGDQSGDRWVRREPQNMMTNAERYGGWAGSLPTARAQCCEGPVNVHKIPYSSPLYRCAWASLPLPRALTPSLPGSNVAPVGLGLIMIILFPFPDLWVSSLPCSWERLCDTCGQWDVRGGLVGSFWKDFCFLIKKRDTWGAFISFGTWTMRVCAKDKLDPWGDKSKIKCY